MAVSSGAAMLGGAALGMLGGSKKSGSSTATQTSAPWAAQAPYLSGLFQRAQRTLNNDPVLGLGPRPDQIAGGATQQLGATIRGDYLNPSSNPFLQNYVNDALGQAKSSFAGQYGGQAGGNLGNSGYQEMLMRTLGNVATNAYGNAYSQERQNQLQASQIAPSIDVANMQSPFAPLQAYQGLVGGNYGGSSTSSQPIYTNPIGGALGGALAGGQLFGMMGGGGQVTNPFSFGGIPGYGG
jgi:hypothetical protein